MIYLGTEIQNTLEWSQSINRSISMSIPTLQKALAWNIINWSDLDKGLVDGFFLACIYLKSVPCLYLTTELQVPSLLTTDIATLLALHPLLGKHNRNLGHPQHLPLTCVISFSIVTNILIITNNTQSFLHSSLLSQLYSSENPSQTPNN